MEANLGDAKQIYLRREEKKKNDTTNRASSFSVYF